MQQGHTDSARTLLGTLQARVKRQAALALLLICVPLAARTWSQGLVETGAWTVPAGVPPPPFGVAETAGPVTHYVDNQSPLATDVDNPTGSSRHPRLTIPASLPAGAVVEVRGGPYSLSANTTWRAAGTVAAPSFIRGIGEPLLRWENTGQRSGQLMVEGSYFVIEGVILEGIQLRMDVGLSHFALRHSVIRRYSPSSNSAAVGMAGTDNALVGNEIHHNGNAEETRELDVHGVAVAAGAQRMWVVDNHIHDNGGDAVQIGSAGAREPWPQFVYVARNRLHGDRENGVDVKRSRDVVISENDISSYAPRESSAGEAIIVHNQPERVWVINNYVHDATRGIASTGAVGFYVVGNVVENIHGQPTQSGRARASHGISSRASRDVHIVNNTIWSVHSGIAYNGNHPVDVVNNIIGNVVPSGFHLGFSTTVSLNHPQTRIASNLLEGHGRFMIGNRVSSSAPQAVRLMKSRDPRFVGPRDFRLRHESPAIDAGAGDRGSLPEVFRLFRENYPMASSIERDRLGTARPVSAVEWDLGAHEGTHPAAEEPVRAAR